MVSRPSYASLFLRPSFNGNGKGGATGFVVQQGTQPYLITNRHVVRGRHNDSNAVLDRVDGLIPNQLQIHYGPDTSGDSWRRRDEPLYDEDGNPRWLEHPTLRGWMDVVALPLTRLDGCRLHPYQFPREKDPLLKVGVSLPLFIIGFPFGLVADGYLGVWVQGTVATELSQSWDAKPAFLIDSRTRPGQSGSPVIAFSPHLRSMMESGLSLMTGGDVERLMGVYSGRVNEDSDLGIVWKASAVEEIVQYGVPGCAADVDFPFPGVLPNGSPLA
jgi:hypothetical protein